ncbi:transcriptional repressor [Bacteroidia bacterium]|nr:transcriptional repressor [Bacteroidia bacterium]
MNKEIKLPELVRQKFDAYLTEHKCRKTPERYAILDVIYSDTRHFNMDTLYNTLAERNFRVSRATLYNTMQLLLDCNLVLKHQFGQNISLYERAYNNDMHYHLICTHCNKVTEYKNPTLQTMLKNLKIKQFTAANFNLNIFGVCNVCTRTIKKQNSLKNKNK